MLEISIHNSKREKIFDYKKSNSKSKKLFGVAGLLAIPSSQEIQRLLENADKAQIDYDAALKAFEESVKGAEISIGEVNKLLEKCECMIDKTPTPKAIDVSNTGKFKDWLLNNSSEVPRISDVPGINEEYLQAALEETQHSSVLERLAKSGEKIEGAISVAEKFYKDIRWIIQHPIHSILIVLEGIAPIIVSGSVIIIIIGLIAKLLGAEKLFNMNTKDMIINPIIFLIIYLILITALRCVVG